jgi:hypothetical protein
MRKWFINLPDENLAYFAEGTDHFDDYVEAVGWAQDFAALNRRMMMTNVIRAVRTVIAKPFEAELEAINCHHNYVRKENHFGENVLVTRKGAVRAAKGVMGIIPGSMGAKSFIVRGRGNADSFDSCSHGAGRLMSRTEAKKTFTLDDHILATEGVECRKDAGRDRRDPGGLQADRGRHGRPGGPGRDRPHAEAGGVREGVGGIDSSTGRASKILPCICRGGGPCEAWWRGLADSAEPLHRASRGPPPPKNRGRNQEEES